MAYSVGWLLHRHFQCTDSPRHFLVHINRLIDFPKILKEYLHLICLKSRYIFMIPNRAVGEAPRCGIIASSLVPDTSRNFVTGG